MSELAPVSVRERVVALDVLRGFALCGVLIVNVFWIFGGRAWGPPAKEAVVDRAAAWFVVLFVESKAQTMLTFLFGFGFAAQLLRAQQRHEPVMGMYLRRLAVLLAIGALHVIVLWWGDVTWTYAIAGLGLLVFQRASNRTRLVCAGILIFVPFLLGLIPVLGEALGGVFLEPGQVGVELQRFAAATRSASFTGMMPAHLRIALVWEAPIWFWYSAWLIGRFLVGYVAGTQRWFDREGAGRLALFRKLLWYGLAVGAASSAMTAAMQLGAFEDYELTTAARIAIGALQQAGLLGLAAAYMAIVVLLIQRPAWRRVLQLVAPAGRMPLTTYIAQSVICTFVFYGWGLGWAGRLGAAACLGLALAIFALQVVTCHLWLRWFRVGPLEWVWRRLVYLRPLAMRVARPAP